MILDTEDDSVIDGLRLSVEVCVIGGGPAGITLARALRGTGLRVLILESGGLDPEAATQDLGDGELVGDPMATPVENPVRDLRVRVLGGASQHWQGLCRPLDRVDFVPLAHRPESSWPFLPEELEPYYVEAQSDCELGSFLYDGVDWARELGIELPSSPGMRPTVLQQSPPTHFGERYRDDLEEAEDTAVMLHANVVRFTRAGSRVSGVEAQTLGGKRITVNAEVTVVATGGIEVARLLLVGDGTDTWLGPTRDLVGRYFAEHPRLSAAQAVVRLDRAVAEALTDMVPAPRDGEVPLRFALAPTARAMDELGLPNGAVLLNASLSVLDDNRGEGIDATAVQGLLRSGGGPDPFALVTEVVWEQVPNPDSRVTLGSSTDAIGMPQVSVDWALTDDDRTAPRRLLEWFARELGSLDIGRVQLTPSSGPLDEATYEVSAHHMGTARMHPDAEVGVVDANGAVHGIDDLYVAGSAVFPTTGWSNPTLTIVALAHRLAEHLRGRLR